MKKLQVCFYHGKKTGPADVVDITSYYSHLARCHEYRSYYVQFLQHEDDRAKVQSRKGARTS
jgi:hypothetical protein